MNTQYEVSHCQEPDCKSDWRAVSINPTETRFRCLYHWLEYYRIKNFKPGITYTLYGIE